MNGQLESALSSILKSAILDAAREFFPRATSDQPSTFQPNATTERMLLRSSEAAKLLAISERHLHSLTQTGHLPCVRVGRLVRYCPHTIQAWIRRTEGAAQEPLRALDRSRSDQPPRATRHPAQKKAKAERTSRPKPKKLASTSRIDANSTTTQQSCRVESSRSKPRSATSFIAQRIGVSEDEMPKMTNGELMRIAEVDIPTLHGWQYHNRDMPSNAIENLERHFREHLGREQ